jgi:hypothetical protein
MVLTESVAYPDVSNFKTSICELSINFSDSVKWISIDALFYGSAVTFNLVT